MSGLLFGLLGSGEFEPWAAEVDSWLLDRARTGDGHVLVLPTASAPEGDAVFGGWADRGVAHYRELGVRAELVPIRTREDAADPTMVAPLERASMVFFSGGNPAYLAATLRDTPFWLRLLRGLDEGIAYGGCSAGVACLPELAPDSDVDGFGPELWRPGLGLFRDTVLGPHWDVLDEFVPGLTSFIESSTPPGARLVGIDETTAMVGDGDAWQVVGRGGVHVFQDGGRSTTYPAGASFELPLTSPRASGVGLDRRAE